MISPSAQAALAELNEIVRLDGAELRIVKASPPSISLTLDLTASTCPECVLPRELMLQLLVARLAEADPDLGQIDLDDPRESTSWVSSGH
jgi:hypothetical protein